MYTNNIDTVIEIFTKAVTLNQLFEILVGSSDNSYINLNRDMSTHSIKLTICQNPQQASLSFGRHITNLIQK